MQRKILTLLVSLFIGMNAFSQDCENYFIYQQNDTLKFTFQGFMVEPGQSIYNWDFGDGTTANGKVVSHSYDPQPATVYEVCLYTETFDSLGNPCYDTTCQNITVGNAPGCTAFFFGNASISNPMTWSFNDFSSGSPDVWMWDFGDGGTSNAQSPLYTFQMDGTYNVCLTIVDSSANCEDTYCMEIIVVGNPIGGDCENNFTYSSTDLVTFDFSSYMVDSTLQALSYTWDFDDGSTGSGQFITHTFEAVGAAYFNVCLTTVYYYPGAVDSCYFTTCHDVFVNNTINCQAFYDWEFGAQPLSIVFTDNSTGGPSSWIWDFGDSTFSYIPNPTHKFQHEGIYNVCLTITNDSNGCTSTLCSEINVSNVPPPVDCNNTITHTASSNIYTFDFHGEAFSNGLNVSTTSTFAWNLGDGNTANGQDITHTYASTGSYAVTLTTISILNNSDTCIAFSSDSIFISDQSYCIKGMVFADSALFLDAGQVDLSLYDPQNNAIVNIESVALGNDGQYLFEDVNYGNGLIYYVQAMPTQQSAYYGQFVPTYHQAAVHWTSAQIASAEICPATMNHNIQMQESTAAGSGTGSISGIIYNGDTKEIIQDMEVLLLNENMETLSYTFSDENGMFDFSALAFGIYYVYPERVGIETSGFIITLSEEESSIEMNIIVGNGTASLSVEENSIISFMDELYPNPANTQINISISAEKAVKAELSVFNQLGQQMLVQSEILSKGLNKIELNISGLPESVYYLRLQTREGKPLMKSFIKF